ncbi:DUF5988 family protein [Actinoplanes siamensis]|uniref:Uncharacterized protein n=1 Tax=Actinoplanes siamensis TaxID=1223317 RepID=A0A919N9L2_9ACTN|nr:DUF5988 family protein [Actinoplanes siamensis]GIF07062.1 hypothetical protein Asi03nite_46000 [Actinoplanes siamensis]
MSTAEREDAPQEIQVLLRGGPYPTPTAVRVSRQAIAYGKVKIARDGGYDHFERVGDGPPQAGETFVWTTRTRVAE